MSDGLDLRWFLGAYATMATVATAIFMAHTPLGPLEAALAIVAAPAVMLLYHLETTDPDADVSWEEVDDD